MIETQTDMYFTGWSEYLDRSANGTPTTDRTRTSREGARPPHKDGMPWNGTKSFDEAHALAVKGWPTGAKKALALSQTIEQRLYSLVEVPVINYDVSGELLDVSRYCAGEPEHWGVWDKVLRDGEGTKYVHIVVNGFVSCGVPIDALIARGAVIAALVNLLELAGCRAKVTLCDAMKGNEDEYRVWTPLKAFDEVLDIDRLAYALAHPSMFRRHCFSVMETIPACLKVGAYSYYGSPGASIPDKGDIYLDQMTHADTWQKWVNAETSTAWVTNELKQQGVIKE